MEQQQPLGGRYALGEVLGRGGMAEVRQARDLRLNRTVAVKVLRADLTADPSWRVRFGREAQSAAALNHPGIVAVFDTGEDAVGGVPLPYIVMEHVRGATLSELLAQGELPSPARAVRLTADILDALGHAHEHGIVHRDVKPANVMVAPDGNVKVMDFGIAHALAPAAGTALTQAGMVIGTAEYLSPEQARGEPVDARTDLYSTGCLLYELLTGQPPFSAETPLATAWRHLEEEPVPPSRHRPDLPPALDDVVLTALAKDRDQRFHDAAGMRVALEAALPRPTGPLTAAGPAVEEAVTPPEPAGDPAPPRRPRRRAGRLTAVLAGGTALAALAVGYTVQHQNSAPTSIKAPDLTGVTVLQARRSARDAGLRIGDVAYGGCPVPALAGTVCEQQPAAGTPVAQGSALTVHLPVPRRAVQ
ncbi:protein kinase [Kitasatospora sp. NPDC052896]|uniref:protein kinase domain-containing protein n=1 Tax=Kitasatospora sp. NPDC052896 TaxID=3364061 RepID=UPI0037CAFB85